jgi:hypothetical protein
MTIPTKTLNTESSPLSLEYARTRRQHARFTSECPIEDPVMVQSAQSSQAYTRNVSCPAGGLIAGNLLPYAPSSTFLVVFALFLARLTFKTFRMIEEEDDHEQVVDYHISRARDQRGRFVTRITRINHTRKDSSRVWVFLSAHTWQHPSGLCFFLLSHTITHHLAPTESRDSKVERLTSS